MGCYRDCFGGRDLPVYKGKATRQECAARCVGYKYIGHQGNQDCRCGNRYGSQGKVAGCRCEADFIGYCKQCVFRIATESNYDKQVLAGHGANVTAEEARDTDTGFIGCYKDGYGGHDLPIFKVFCCCKLSVLDLFSPHSTVRAAACRK